MPRALRLASAAVFASAIVPSAASAQSAPVEVEVRGSGGSASRGSGDQRVDRDAIEASPRRAAEEMLSAAPGVFVDHEEGEGLGNDVFLRGFDVDHGSGIEMRLGAIPLNAPLHVHGQGYVDPAFLIPEVVRGIRVLEGPFDPRQGDAAIAGSAYFDLGVPQRGYHLTTTVGSFGNARVAGVLAPPGADEETFLAYALRRSDGFGPSRATRSASANAQYAVALGASDRLRLVATAFDARSSLPGVLRQDDVDAGRVGYSDAYPAGPGFFGGGQSVETGRVLLGAEVSHEPAGGARLAVAPWLTWTADRARENFTGSVQRSVLDPALGGRGDLFELMNREVAGGASASFRLAPVAVAPWADLDVEPGVTLRIGRTDQSKSLLDPNAGLAVWDRRIDAALDTRDVGGYVDVGLKLFRRLRIAGGPRVDLLSVDVDDHLGALLPAAAPDRIAVRGASGVAVGPRFSATYDVAGALAASLSYGEGFRSLDASALPPGGAPYSKARSGEAGFKLHTSDNRYTATASLFETRVDNELVFDAQSGGLETEDASVRSGMVASIAARPWSWFFVSSALSLTRAVFDTATPGAARFVPDVPPVLFRTDLSTRARVATVAGKPATGKLAVGYTFLAPRHLTDALVGSAYHVVNAGASVRWTWLEVGVDAYNLLDLRYADDGSFYASNWSTRPGPHPATQAVPLSAAPPLTALASVTLHL